ncbi:DnaJ-like protein DjlA [bioreactor metagenome]|uniref:DnaJ-like protein DjlA n=1 Tax=bioreactor metagenome TaxID=1076179 RepID=A0A645EHH0_9ZZZZ
MSIINRIINITRANFSSATNNIINKNDDLFLDDDDELKKIIDELDNHTSFNEQTFDKQAEPKNPFQPNNAEQITQEVSDALKVLEISIDSDEALISKAFRAKLKQFHPDKHPESTPAELEYYKNKTTELIEAYKIIKKHKNYL